MPIINSLPRLITCSKALSIGAFLILFMLPAEVFAFDSITVDSGYGLDDTRLVRLSFATGKSRHNLENNRWSWFPYWEANLSYWYLYKGSKGVDDLFEVGLTPNIRFEPDQPWSWGRPYLEAGIGVHLLSKVHIGTRDMSSSFQFGSHAGIGIRFGDRERWQLGWRIEHLSNADLKGPNPGINFSMVRIGYFW